MLSFVEDQSLTIGARRILKKYERPAGSSEHTSRMQGAACGSMAGVRAEFIPLRSRQRAVRAAIRFES